MARRNVHENLASADFADFAASAQVNGQRFGVHQAGNLGGAGDGQLFKFHVSVDVDAAAYAAVRPAKPLARVHGAGELKICGFAVLLDFANAGNRHLFGGNAAAELCGAADAHFAGLDRRKTGRAGNANAVRGEGFCAFSAAGNLYGVVGSARKGAASGD